MSVFNGTKPHPVAAIFKMAAILDFFQLALYPIFFSISISIIVQNFMLVTENPQFTSYFHHFLPLKLLSVDFECMYTQLITAIVTDQRRYYSTHSGTLEYPPMLVINTTHIIGNCELSISHYLVQTKLISLIVTTTVCFRMCPID